MESCDFELLYECFLLLAARLGEFVLGKKPFMSPQGLQHGLYRRGLSQIRVSEEEMQGAGKACLRKWHFSSGFPVVLQTGTNPRRRRGVARESVVPSLHSREAMERSHGAVKSQWLIQNLAFNFQLNFWLWAS